MSSSTEGSRRMPFSTSRRKRKIGCHCRPSIATIHWISWKLLRFFVAYKILGVARPFHRLPGSSGLPSTCPHVARVSGIGHTPQGIPTWEKRKATPCTLLSKGYANHVRFGALQKRINTMITFLRAKFHVPVPVRFFWDKWVARWKEGGAMCQSFSPKDR